MRFLPITFIIVFTFFIWKGVANQALIGEGPIYFNPPYLTMLDTNPLRTLWSRHDTQALLFFHFAKNIIFKDNIILYMFFLLVGSAFVNVALYILMKKITGSTFASLATAIFFTANFVGSYEILGLGYYQWFIQRVPNFGLALIGFIFFVEYFRNRDRKNYLLSLFFYLMSVFLSRYTIHTLPLFVFYTFFLDRGRNKKFIHLTLLIIPFLIGSLILFKAQGLVAGTKDVTLLESLKLIPNVFYQITYLSLPFLRYIPNYMFSDLVRIITIPLILIYSILTYIVYKRFKKARPFILSIILSIPLSVYLSIILNPYFIKYYDSSRYLYYTSLLISLFWGIVIWHITKTKRIYLFICILAIFLWILYNKQALDKKIFESQDKHTLVLTTFTFIKSNKNSIKPNSTVVVPSEIGSYGAGMLSYFYGQKNRNYLSNTPDGNINNLLYLKYNPSNHTMTISKSK